MNPSSFAAAARRGGNITKRNHTGPRATKLTRDGSRSGSNTTSFSSSSLSKFNINGDVRRKVEILTDEQEKALEERRAKERGRKLLLALSSGNLDDFPSLPADVEDGSTLNYSTNQNNSSMHQDDDNEEERDELNETNRSIQSNTTEIAWEDDDNDDNDDNDNGNGNGNDNTMGASFKEESSSEKSEENEEEDVSTNTQSSHSKSNFQFHSNAKTQSKTTNSQQQLVGSSSSTTTSTTRDTTKQRMMREKLWGVLFSNVNRTVEEVYYFCEFESDKEHTQEAIELLENWRIDFQALLEGFQRQIEFSNSNVDSNGIRRRLSSSSANGGLDEEGSEQTEMINKGGVAWEVKKSSPQHLHGTQPPTSGIRAALRTTVSPPRQSQHKKRLNATNHTNKKISNTNNSSASNNRNRRNTNHASTDTMTMNNNQSIIRIDEFEASCSTDDQPVRLNVVVEKHRTDRKLWADMCDEEDELNDDGEHEGSSTGGGSASEMSTLESSTDSNGK